MKATNIFLLLFISSFIISCQSVAQEKVIATHDVKSFGTLRISSGIDAYLTQGETESVQIEADEALQQRIIVETEGNNLIVKLDDFPKNLFSRKGPIKAYITFINLEEIHASGGSDVFGSGALNFDNLKMKASGGSDIKLVLNANELEVECSGGSDIILGGKVVQFKGKASGGSDIKAENLETNISDISVSGGSDAYVRVNQELNASASGGSDIFYSGEPQKVNSNASGGSDIKKR